MKHCAEIYSSAPAKKRGNGVMVSCNEPTILMCISIPCHLFKSKVFLSKYKWLIFM